MLCNVSDTTICVCDDNREYFQVLESIVRQYGQTYSLVASTGATRGAATTLMNGTNTNASSDSIGALFSTASSAVTAATTSQASVTAQRRKRLADDIVFFVTLNNLDLSCSNMRTLRLHLDTQFADIGKTDGKTMIAHCLDGISETAEQFAKAAQRVTKHIHTSYRTSYRTSIIATL